MKWVSQVTMIHDLIESVKEEVIEWRRYLHKYPELSFHEEKTAQFVYETLQTFGDLEISRPTKTSVVARLIGQQPGKVIALRADMDALPIEEENNFDFVSQNSGVMHACGHDGHTAMLLGTAKILLGLKEQIKGEVRFIFQHAEEVFPGGAEELVQAGVMDEVDVVIGSHLWSPLEIGKIGVAFGPMMASADTFSLVISGNGGHAGFPHQTVDSIAIGAEVVTNLQHIVSRATDPLDNLVVSVTQFIGGTAINVIPDSVHIQGSVRCFDSKLRETVPTLMERVIKGVTEAHGATYKFNYHFGYRAVINDENITSVIENTVRDVLGDEAFERIKPVMGAEDFSAYQQKGPGTFFFIGAGNVEKDIIYPHHHPRFTIDEDALQNGVKIFVHAAMRILSS